MKYVIILPDGAADEPLPQLEGRTPLEAAHIPNMDWICQSGRLGRAVTVPDGFTPATDVATLSVFGYDPARYYTGRAPLEAAARGLTVGPDGVIFRCNFVTVLDGRMKDFTAGHIPQDETDRLIADLNTLFAGDPFTFHAGVSYRNLLIVEGVGDLNVRCAPPHDIPDQPVAEHRPQGDGAAFVEPIMSRAAEMIAQHEVNHRRRAEGREPVTGIWLWGQGRPTELDSFEERFGCRGAVITGVDIIRGIAVCMGMKLIEVPGATGYIGGGRPAGIRRRGRARRGPGRGRSPGGCRGEGAGPGEGRRARRGSAAGGRAHPRSLARSRGAGSSHAGDDPGPLVRAATVVLCGQWRRGPEWAELL
jgi:2,3-bisphosphoglycerate-independent phosphoglycerate mutase